MRNRFIIATFTGLLAGLAVSQLSFTHPVQSQDSPPAKKLGKDAELEGLKASADAFEKAFNAKDSKAIGAQFIENAEAVD